MDLVNMLSEWKGADAQVWDYCTNSCVLRIKLSFPSSGNLMLLTMKHCDKVEFSPGWGNSNIEVSDFMGEFGRRSKITDGSNLNVDCGDYFVKEYKSYTEIPPNGW